VLGLDDIDHPKLSTDSTVLPSTEISRGLVVLSLAKRG